jgi:hypothetical protein
MLVGDFKGHKTADAKKLIQAQLISSVRWFTSTFDEILYFCLGNGMQICGTGKVGHITIG